MVYLIGGSSHVGKTLVAQKLMEKLGYPYLSLDHLKMGLIRTGMTKLTVNDDYEMRFFLWPIAAEMVKTVIENKQNLIVEGCYIPGSWRDWIPTEYLKDIKCSFIVMSEPYIRGHFSEICSEANCIESRIDDHPDMERLIMCSRNFKNDCIENGIRCIEITDKYDISDIMDSILA